MNLKNILFFLALSATSFCFCKQKDEALAQMSLEHIIANSASCVKGMHEDRIYLQDDKLHATANGIFLILNEKDEYVPIPELFSDSAGCYVKAASSLSSDYAPPITSPCPGCRKPYIISCQNPDCPLKKRPKKK